jgi:hypothetical protein
MLAKFIEKKMSRTERELVNSIAAHAYDKSPM